MYEIIPTIISTLGVGGIVSGVVLLKINKSERKRETENKARAEENILIMTGLKAVGHLAEATALAQKCGKVNGVMDTALDFYKDFTGKLNDYLLRQNAEKNHGR